MRKEGGWAWAKGLVAGFGLLAVLTLPPSAVFAAGDGCPSAPESLKKPDCSGKSGSEMEACNKCAGGISNDGENGMHEIRKLRTTCVSEQSACVVDLAKDTPAVLDTLSAHERAAAKKSRGEQCERDKKENALETEKVAKKCREAITKACKGPMESVGKKEADKCGKLEKEAKKNAKDNKAKEKAQGQDKNKGEDNAKKTGSEGGGGAPPSPPGGGDKGGGDTPQEMAQYPSETDPGLATGDEEKAGIESMSLAGDEKVTGMNGIGFTTEAKGDDPTVTSGSAPHSYGAYGGSGDSDRGSGLGQSSLAPLSTGNGLGSTGGSSALGGGGSRDSSGSSKEKDLAKEKDTNPFAIPPGGGQLSVPRGKPSSGEADNVMDARAANEFDKEFKAVDEGSRELASASEDEESGYTVFKMVNFRYQELKRKGNL